MHSIVQQKLATDNMLYGIETHPNLPVYADVFHHPGQGLCLCIQYGKICRRTCTVERRLVVGFALLVAHVVC